MATSIKEYIKEAGFNAGHPELKKGEIWLTNIQNLNSDVFQQIGWKTKRLGNTAYCLDGEILNNSQSKIWRPVFVQICELLDSKVFIE